MWTSTKRIDKKLDETAQEHYELYWTNPGSKKTWNNSCTATYLLSLKQSKLDELGMRDTAEEARMNS